MTGPYPCPERIRDASGSTVYFCVLNDGHRGPHQFHNRPATEADVTRLHSLVRDLLDRRDFWAAVERAGITLPAEVDTLREAVGGA